VNQGIAAAAFVLGAAGVTTEAESPLTELAKAAQNPLAELVSLPFQNNTNFGYGPSDSKGTQNVLNIQPVVPITLTRDWNLITRTIFPLVWQPSSLAGGSGSFGLGEINSTAWVSPANPGDLTWGIGPAASFPTSTSANVGSQSTWGLGPSAVAVAQPHPWVVGVLANNLWNIAGDTSNKMLIQYFINYNFEDGWYLTSSPIITANWNAASGQKWVVPFGAGFGKLFVLAKLPINGSVTAYYNAVKPDIGPEWTLRVQAAILLPKQLLGL